MNKIILTTSWDDGYPLDFRLALLLKKYKIKGTFYIPLKNKERPVITKKLLIKISQMGFEIGSHTLTHPTLNRLNYNELISEIKDSKKQLEEIIKKNVVSFCYPKGRFNKKISQILNAEGYKLARTTSLFHTNINFNPYFMPTTFHFSKRSYLSYLKQGVRELNFVGLYKWLLTYRLKMDPLKLSLKILDHLSKTGGYFHIWGHSWEIEEKNLWKDLEKFFFEINKRKNIVYLTNYEVIKYLNL